MEVFRVVRPSARPSQLVVDVHIIACDFAAAEAAHESVAFDHGDAKRERQWRSVSRHPIRSLRIPPAPKCHDLVTTESPKRAESVTREETPLDQGHNLLLTNTEQFRCLRARQKRTR